MPSGSFCGVKNLAYEMGRLSVFLKEQVFTITKACHSQRGVGSVLKIVRTTAQLVLYKINELGSIINLEQYFIGLYTIVVPINVYANEIICREERQTN